MKKLTALILSLLILLSFLASCKTAEDGETTADITTAPETESSVNLREHTLMTDAFGNEFYADDEVNVLELSRTLYNLAGKPDFLNEEYIEFFDRIYTIPFDRPSRRDREDAGFDIAIEWAHTHGILFTYRDVEGGAADRHRVHYKWGKYIDGSFECQIYTDNPIGFKRSETIMSLYFCAEEMELDIFEREDISGYADSGTLEEGDIHYNTYINRWKDREDSNDLKYVSMNTLWSWAEACGMIVWDEDGKINQNELVTRGELSAMVDAFMNHYGIER